MQNRRKKIFPVSVVIPMRNSKTTILLTLRSLLKQDYPIKEIIIVDNVSTDGSIEQVKKYINRNRKIPIFLLLNKINIGVGGSYNRGVMKAKATHIVLMHSDSTLGTNKELSRLVAPFYEDPDVVATYSSIVLPKRIWMTYTFWQKTLSSRVVGIDEPGLNGKFDCINKKVFKEIGGFNVKQYGHHIMVGADDSDLHFRLARVGKTVATKARVIHLHYLGTRYSIGDFIENRKLLAKSYGRLLRLEFSNVGFGGIVFLVKPILALSFLAPFLYPFNIFIIFIFSIWYYRRMYATGQNWLSINILMLPFITSLLVFLETFWMLKAFLFLNKSTV